MTQLELVDTQGSLPPGSRDDQESWQRGQETCMEK